MTLLLKKQKSPARVDIVPLIDVLTVLIFFFIITMSFKARPVADIVPPEIKASGHINADDDIMIAINENGEIFFNNLVVSNEELSKALKRTSKINTSQNILIIADENSELKHIAYVLDCCKKFQFEKIHLQTR